MKLMTTCIKRVSSYIWLIHQYLDELELEKKRYMVKLEESTRGLDKLRDEKESLEVRALLLKMIRKNQIPDFNLSLTDLRKLIT